VEAGRPVVSVLVPAERRHTYLLRASVPPLFRAATPLEVVIVNAGAAGAGPLLDPPVRTVDAGAGAGFCRAINAGIAATAGELVLFSNADLFLDGDYVDALVDFLARHPEAACAGGKLLRYDLARDRTTRLVDSTGLVAGRSRRVWDRGEGEADLARDDREEEVFGVSGAGLLVRRSALERARTDGEYLDESFIAYKDDVDLAWRLRRLGLRCWYVPSAVGYHARTSAHSRTSGSCSSRTRASAPSSRTRRGSSAARRPPSSTPRSRHRGRSAARSQRSRARSRTRSASAPSSGGEPRCRRGSCGDAGSCTGPDPRPRSSRA